MMPPSERTRGPSEALPGPDGRLAGARALARLLDSAARVPGTNIRFGLDSVLGLVPGLGDVAGAALAGYMILLGTRLGVPRSVVLRMVSNVAIDTIVGAVPILGDLFDVAWKSNTRNLALLERSIDPPSAATRPVNKLVVVGVVLALTVLIAGGITLGVLVVKALIGALS